MPNIKFFFIASFFIFLFFVSEIIYLSETTIVKDESIENKMKIVQLISLPDLAIHDNLIELRHKSYSSISTKLPNDGEISTNSKMSFVY